MNEALTLVIATRNRHKVEEIRTILSNRFQYLTLNDFPAAPEVVEDAPTFAGNATKKAVELANWLAQTRNSELAIRNCFVLADDSGLEVDVLNGAPGVHSARFAALDGEPVAGATQVKQTILSALPPPLCERSRQDCLLHIANSSDGANNVKLLRLLKDVPLEKRTARFHCVLALVEVNPQSPLSSLSSSAEERAGVRSRSASIEIRHPQLFDGVCEGRISFAASGQGGFGYDPLFVPIGYEHSFAELGEEVKNRISHRARALEKLRGWAGRG